MQQNIHGGDIYSRPVRLDFSVNGNPLGMPAEARLSLLAAINHVGEYPDAAAGIPKGLPFTEKSSRICLLYMSPPCMFCCIFLPFRFLLP